MAGWFAYNQMLTDGGHFVAGASLQPSATATVVHNDTGAVTDGPYVETKEQIGGFYVVSAADLDEALPWPRRCRPRARRGAPGHVPSGRVSVEDSLTRLSREESGRVLALLAGRLGDLDLADEAVQDALVEAVRSGRPTGSRTTPPAG